MELRQLRYFVAVAEEVNFSRAAKKLFLTQPALNRQIKALEDEIGQCPLERQAHSIRLTPVGELLLREARDLLQHAEQMLDRVRPIASASDPLCIAAGHRTGKAEDKPLAVFVEELRKAAAASG